MADTPKAQPTESEEILALLAEQRHTLLITVRNLTDEQARMRTTPSAFNLGGILKHMASGEGFWGQIIDERPIDLSRIMTDNSHWMTEVETLGELRSRYSEVAVSTESLVRSLPSLDAVVALPETPWWPAPTPRWTVRHCLLHLLRETAHHCGHADIIREAIDGANTTMQLGT
ncbi:MAG: DinB family protein [Chloroflexota bacterium]